MPSNIDWITLADSLRKEYGALSITEEEIKRMREQAKLKKQELDIDRGRLEKEIREQAMKDAMALDQVMHPEKYGVPPAVQTAKVEAETGGIEARTGLTEAEILTEKERPGLIKAQVGATRALEEQREEGGAGAKLSLATIETQITQTIKAMGGVMGMSEGLGDMAGQLLKAQSVEELNSLYTTLKPKVPKLNMLGEESTDPLMFDRLYDLLIKRFQYTTKPLPEGISSTSETESTGLSSQDQELINRVLGF